MEGREELAVTSNGSLLSEVAWLLPVTPTVKAAWACDSQKRLELTGKEMLGLESAGTHTNPE